jgi:general secretion pathway protein J
VEAAVTGDSGSGGLTLGGSDSQPAYFRASAQAVEWKSAVLFGENYGGVFILRVAREGDDVVLRWREPGNQLRPMPWEDTPSKVLVSAVEEFQVALRPEFRGAWVTGWDQFEPPAVVRFRIQTRGRFWPELIVQVQR